MKVLPACMGAVGWVLLFVDLCWVATGLSSPNLLQSVAVGIPIVLEASENLLTNEGEGRSYFQRQHTLLGCACRVNASEGSLSDLHV